MKNLMRLKKHFLLILLCLVSTECINATNFVLFLGNPGTGKSTLLNSVINEEVAESGLSAGRGVTKQLQRISRKGVDFLDTPGLSDSMMEEEAALEIEKALKFNGTYAIFFILSAKNGRINMADCNSINRIMKAIRVSNKKFNIIFNGISSRERNEIFDDPQSYGIFLERLKGALEFGYSSITLIDFDRNIDGEKNRILSLEPKLIQFILEGADRFFIPSSSVQRIQTEAAIKRELRERQEVLQQLRIEKERLEMQEAEKIRQLYLPVKFSLWDQ